MKVTTVHVYCRKHQKVISVQLIKYLFIDCVLQASHCAMYLVRVMRKTDGLTFKESIVLWEMDIKQIITGNFQGIKQKKML